MSIDIMSILIFTAHNSNNTYILSYVDALGIVLKLKNPS